MAPAATDWNLEPFMYPEREKEERRERLVLDYAIVRAQEGNITMGLYNASLFGMKIIITSSVYSRHT